MTAKEAQRREQIWPSFKILKYFEDNCCQNFWCVSEGNPNIIDLDDKSVLLHGSILAPFIPLPKWEFSVTLICGIELRRRKIRSSDTQIFWKRSRWNFLRCYCFVVIPLELFHPLKKRNMKTQNSRIFTENLLNDWKVMQLCRRLILKDTWSSFIATSSYKIYI